MSALLPRGVPLSDAPWNLVEAINAGLTFLQFLELPEDERPPRNIWLDGDRLRAHFDEVSRRRKEKYGLDGRKEIDGDVAENEDGLWAG